MLRKRVANHIENRAEDLDDQEIKYFLLDNT